MKKSPQARHTKITGMRLFNTKKYRKSLDGFQAIKYHINMTMKQNSTKKYYLGRNWKKFCQKSI